MARTPTIAAIGFALAAATACATQPAGKPTATVTVTRHPSAPTATPSTGTSSPSNGSPTPSAMPTALPGTCDTLLPLPVVADALGHSVPGQTAFVVGVAEADIGRLSYLNCRYGLTGAQAPPKIEIGISLYRSADDAAQRIPATVDDFTAHGATAAAVTVDGVPGQLLLGGSGTGYGPTIVLASGQRTVAVTLAPNASADPRKDLTALAALALKRTGG